MEDSEKSAYKNRLKEHGLRLIKSRIAVAKAAMSRAQEAANQEEKSSVGDKYETSRAMNQNEKDMYSRQLAENSRELAALESLPVHFLRKSVLPGTFVECDGISFFLAAGLGKQKIDGKDILFISPAAPIAGILMNKVPGDTISFNNKPYCIRSVF